VQLEENEWEIRKWTARTFKITGNVLVADQYDIFPAEEVIKLKLKPKSLKEFLLISAKLKEEAILKGWLIQEIRFMKDGRTPLSTAYRMGPGLFEYERLKAEAISGADNLLKEALLLEVELSKDIVPQEFLQIIIQYTFEPKDVEGWLAERVRKFHHFLIAYLQLKRKQPLMEYKEIDATYYKRIGGSKAFDANRDVFITRLEKWLNAPINELGIISVGSIVPVVFTGNLTGEFSSYTYGTVHATTDIAVSDDSFQTTAKILWLVENRAVLTRMAKEVGFLEDTDSFVLGVDGQIRGAHRKLIKQLCQNSSIHQVMIWVDYDKAGDIISNDLVNLVEDIPYRLIGNEENVFSTYEAYKKWSATVQYAGQEMTLGGVPEWTKWINL